MSSACSQVGSASRDSAWGRIITFAQTEQLAAPQIWPHSDGVTALWIGTDDAGIHHDTARITGNQLPDATVLPLPPVHPFNQQIIPAGRGRAHILWLDAHVTFGENRLFSGIITTEAQPERGPILLSDRRTAHYATLLEGDGSINIVWSGGPIAEPNLYLQHVDALGRPQPIIIELIHDADWPALARTNNGTIYLAWQQVSSGTTFVGKIADDTLEDIQQVPAIPNMRRGDRITDFRLALDSTHRYLFWNMTHIDGESETWMAASAITATSWQRPTRVGIREFLETPFETGFNTAMSNVATSGDNWVSHATPIVGQFEILPVAANIDDTTLGVLYFRRGRIQGFQTVVNATVVLSASSLVIDRDRQLYLAWSEPTANRPANLNLTTTRRLS